MVRFIYEYDEWPHFTWKADALLTELGKVRNLQGKLMGKMETLGFALREEATLETISTDVIKSTEIEGKFLHPEQVRSSVAKRLGINLPAAVKAGREVDGVVEMMIDATQNYNGALTTHRLFGWHTLLFPDGKSGMQKIITGSWRNDSTGPMQVVSGPVGKERVHYQAPAAKELKREMKQFIDWFNRKDQELDPVLKSGIAHLWFITIHPFEDGNGRIARAIADMQLARADKSQQRYCSMSAQISKQRKQYYLMLERTQRSGLDITAWLQWYLNCFFETLASADQLLENVLFKARFWEKHWKTYFNKRQRLMLNKLMDGFEGKLNTSKWAKIAKCSNDTALRDIQELVSNRILAKDADAGGRNTHYLLLRKL